MNNVKMGFCRSDITPPLGVHLAGYYYDRPAEGVLDPVYVNAFAVSEGEKSAVVLVCDLCGIYSDAAREWAKEIAVAAGLPAEAVFLCHTHTHTGPVTKHYRDSSDPMYDAWIIRRLGDAAVMALRDCKPVTYVKGIEGECKGLAFTRRFKMKDGRYQTWANRKDPDIVAYAGPVDESIRMARIGREGGDEIVLVNFQLHPDSISGSLVSADFPGVLRNLVEAGKPGTKCIFLNGCEGQLAYCDWWHDSLLRDKSRVYKHVGKILADWVLDNYEKASDMAGEGVQFAQNVIPCRTKRDSSRVSEAERLIAIHEAGRDDDIGPDWVATPLVAESYILRRLEKENTDYIPMTVSAVSVGGLVLLGLPGEPFCEIGMHIRSNSPYPMTMVCCQTNGCEGYYPNAVAYDQGGYEPCNTRFPKGIGEILQDAGVELLKELDAQK